MGMAASQVRFLSLQNRKNTVGLNLLTLSNRKMALTRDMSRVAAKYNEAMNQKLLKWSNDSGATYQDLSYDLMMKQNDTNGTLPYIISTAAGQVVLDDNQLKDKDGNLLTDTDGKALTYKKLATYISEFSGDDKNGNPTYNNTKNVTSVSGGASTLGNEYKIITAASGYDFKNSLRFDLFNKLGILSDDSKAKFNETLSKLYGNQTVYDTNNYAAVLKEFETNPTTSASKYGVSNVSDIFGSFTTTDGKLDINDSQGCAMGRLQLAKTCLEEYQDYLKTPIERKLYDSTQYSLDSLGAPSTLQGMFVGGNDSHLVSTTSGGKTSYAMKFDSIFSKLGTYTITDGCFDEDYHTWSNNFDYRIADQKYTVSWAGLYDMSGQRYTITDTGASSDVMPGNIGDYNLLISSDGHSFQQDAANKADSVTGISVLIAHGDYTATATDDMKNSIANLVSDYKSALISSKIFNLPGLEFAADMTNRVFQNNTVCDPVHRKDDAIQSAAMNASETNGIGANNNDHEYFYSVNMTNMMNVFNTFYSIYMKTGGKVVSSSETMTLSDGSTYKYIENTASSTEYKDEVTTDLHNYSGPNTSNSFTISDGAVPPKYYETATTDDKYAEKIFGNVPVTATDGTVSNKSVITSVNYFSKSNSGAPVGIETLNYTNGVLSSTSYAYKSGTDTVATTNITYSSSGSLTDKKIILKDGINYTKADGSTDYVYTIDLGDGSISPSFYDSKNNWNSTTYVPSEYMSKTGNSAHVTDYSFTSSTGTTYDIVTSGHAFTGSNGFCRDVNDSKYCYTAITYPEDEYSSRLEELVLKEQAEVDKLKNDLEDCFTSSENKQMDYYDALFKRISQNGWVYDSKVNKTETQSQPNANNYLNAMLENNIYYVTEVGNLKNDGSYNYANKLATNISKIYQVQDDDEQNQALTQYEEEKTAISNKEQQIDIRMNMLETEQSALKTELDSIKKTIDDNISRTFKIFT